MQCGVQHGCKFKNETGRYKTTSRICRKPSPDTESSQRRISPEAQRFDTYDYIFGKYYVGHGISNV
jgi:hypothetical protein